MHSDTFRLVYLEYLGLKTDLPTCTDVQQIWNTIAKYGPNLQEVIAAMRRGDQILLDNITKYPPEAYKFRSSLSFSADFYECVQEKDAYLRNREWEAQHESRFRLS